MFGLPFLPLPPIAQKLLLTALAAAALLLWGRWWGAAGVYREWIAANEAARVASVKIITTQQVVTERVVTRWRERDREIHIAGETLIKEVPVYVPVSADPVLPRGWRLLHDAAAAADGAVPRAAPGTDVAAADIKASAAAAGVVTNYSTCHANAAQLEALQEWVRQQYRTMNLREAPF